MTSDLRHQRKWNVRELITYLETMPQESPVTLIDADTDYTIELFSVIKTDNEVTFFPCDYNEMRK